MRRSFELGEFFGIAVRVHWSFGLLLAWVALSTLADTGSLLAATAGLLMIGALFSFVVAHEYGHALTARHFGIRTREITLLPIGGLAQLERMPDSPRQELLVALAGPAVNFALAALFALLMRLGHESAGALADGNLIAGPLLTVMLRVNLAMALFNLLPALPMDGGRVLRAALSLAMPAVRATAIAARIARVLAGGMALLGLIEGQTLLVLIAGFVWLAANAERQQAQLRQRGGGPRTSAAVFRYAAGTAPSPPLHGRALEGLEPVDPPDQWIQPDSTPGAQPTTGLRTRRAVIGVDSDGRIRFRVVEDEADERH